MKIYLVLLLAMISGAAFAHAQPSDSINLLPAQSRNYTITIKDGVPLLVMRTSEGETTYNFAACDDGLCTQIFANSIKQICKKAGFTKAISASVQTNYFDGSIIGQETLLDGNGGETWVPMWSYEEKLAAVIDFTGRVSFQNATFYISHLDCI